jgi:hypothetical protein
LAQAELEHATTAQEYAAEELSQSTIQKNEAQVSLNSICKQIRHQSKPFINRRVKLVGLNKNAMWNGRLGTVMKLVTDGSSDDVGRWKVKLDPEWRGRDADGKRLARCDTISLDNTHDCTPPKNNNDNGNGQRGEEGTAANSMNVVVAKAENLELIDNNVREEDELGDNEMFASNVLQQQRSASKSSQKQQQQRKSRDPSIPRRSTNDPVAEVTPESTPVKYNKSESDGRYHEKKKSESKDRQSVHPKHKQQQRNNMRSTNSSQQRQGPRQVSPSKKSQRPWQQQQQQQQSSPYANNKKSSSSTSRSPSTNNNNNNNQVHISTIRRARYQPLVRHLPQSTRTTRSRRIAAYHHNNM